MRRPLILALVFVVPEIPVAANHAAQVAAPVVGGILGRLGKRADPHELAVGGQVRTAGRATLGADDVLPAPAGEEAVVAAGDEPGAVLQRDPVRGLYRLPVRQHHGGDVAAV